MIRDAYLLMADAQSNTASAASTSYIDTQAKGDTYVGDWFVVAVDTAYTTAAGAPTATFTLETANDTDFLTGVTLASSAALLTADLDAVGIVWKVRIPSGVRRYIRGYQTVNSSVTVAFGAAKFDMYIVKDVDVNMQLTA